MQSIAATRAKTTSSCLGLLLAQWSLIPVKGTPRPLLLLCLRLCLTLLFHLLRGALQVLTELLPSLSPFTPLDFPLRGGAKWRGCWREKDLEPEGPGSQHRRIWTVPPRRPSYTPGVPEPELDLWELPGEPAAVLRRGGPEESPSLHGHVQGLLCTERQGLGLEQVSSLLGPGEDGKEANVQHLLVSG